MFGNLGFMEIMFILLAVLLIFGAKRLPEIGASMGKGIREFKSSLTDTQNSLKDDSATRRMIDGSDAGQSAPTSGEPKRLSQ